MLGEYFATSSLLLDIFYSDINLLWLSPISSNLSMVSQTSRQLRGTICGNSCWLAIRWHFLWLQSWFILLSSGKIIFDLRCFLYLNDIRCGKYLSDNAINILCGEKSDWSGSRVCWSYGRCGGRRSGELQIYFNRSNRYYCCYCYQPNSFLIEVNLLGHLTKPWQ